LGQLGCRFPSNPLIVIFQTVWCLRHAKKRAEDLERALVSNINVAMNFQTIQEMKLLFKALHLCYKTQAQYYADISFELIEKLTLRQVEPRCIFVANIMVYHWSRPFASCSKPLLKCYQIGLQTGDTDSAICGPCSTFKPMRFYPAFCSASIIINRR
jgi:hypothetical protein